MMSSPNHLIIVAGGSGSRLKTTLPKQFIEINNKPLLIYSIEKFLAFDPTIRIYISVHPEYLDYLNETLKKHLPYIKIQVTCGGETRFQSVKNALALIENTPNQIVAIHDAARPLVSSDTISKCFKTAKEKGNAVPAINLNESVRQTLLTNNWAVDRANYKLIQTPQCFNIATLKKAFEQTYSPSFTDDASVLEAHGDKINLVEGNIENIKVTYPIDLIVAQHLLK